MIKYESISMFYVIFFPDKPVTTVPSSRTGHLDNTTEIKYKCTTLINFIHLDNTERNALLRIYALCRTSLIFFCSIVSLNVFNHIFMLRVKMEYIFAIQVKMEYIVPFLFTLALKSEILFRSFHSDGIFYTKKFT